MVHLVALVLLTVPSFPPTVFLYSFLFSFCVFPASPPAASRCWRSRRQAASSTGDVDCAVVFCLSWCCSQVAAKDLLLLFYFSAGFAALFFQGGCCFFHGATLHVYCGWCWWCGWQGLALCNEICVTRPQAFPCSSPAASRGQPGELPRSLSSRTRYSPRRKIFSCPYTRELAAATSVAGGLLHEVLFLLKRENSFFRTFM